MMWLIVYLFIGVIHGVLFVWLTDTIQMTFHSFPIIGSLFTNLAVILLWPLVLYMVIATVIKSHETKDDIE